MITKAQNQKKNTKIEPTSLASPGRSITIARSFMENLENWVAWSALPDGQGYATRQFLFKNPKLTQNHMRRLAVVHHPPGGFYKNPETSNEIKAEGNHTYINIIHHAFNQRSQINVVWLP